VREWGSACAEVVAGGGVGGREVVREWGGNAEEGAGDQKALEGCCAAASSVVSSEQNLTTDTSPPDPVQDSRAIAERSWMCGRGEKESMEKERLGPRRDATEPEPGEGRGRSPPLTRSPLSRSYRSDSRPHPADNQEDPIALYTFDSRVVRDEFGSQSKQSITELCRRRRDGSQSCVKVSERAGQCVM
jgi:hypothetical protein